MKDDTIKRSDVIDAAKIILNRFGYKEYSIGFKWAMSVIETISSADRPQGWIPCSERLPSENDEYIITMGKDSFNKEGHVTWAMFDKLKKKFYFPGGRVNYYIAVTAWMPMIKPWKGADDE